MNTTTAAAPADRYCDLVMKGGVTSGVVYPPAICELARQYHFRSIGGTSAGAIAAAVTAAAEYQRRRTGRDDGFRLLEELPARLGAPGAGGHSQLLRLFQPDVTCRRLFAVLTGSLNQSGTARRIAALLGATLLAYWIAALAGCVLGILIGSLDSPLAGVLCLLLAMPLAIGIAIYRDLTRNVVRNNYGLCSGLTVDAEAGEALTPWLHALIQNAAGLPADAAPLTFGDLWRAPGGPPGQNVRSIDLQMFTTNLAHGRPYIFPHLEPTARLFYRSDELRAYLPQNVMDWFDAHAIAYLPHTATDPPVQRALDLKLAELPAAADFPILLAARMSLSFPLLFAAVPLWAIDYGWPPEQRTFRRCMFSDGGISSNFPMHLFDGLLPLWPTFGINLEAVLPGFPDEMLYLPTRCRDGFADTWTRFDGAPKPASRLGGFLFSIIGTMQNWNDNALSRMPGVRDRIVRLRLKDDEGGFNLDMDRQLIERIAMRGRAAAVKLIERYVPQAKDAASAPGWDQQRWIRRDVLIDALNERMAGLAQALRPNIPHASSYQELTSRAQATAPPCHDHPLTPQQVRALDALTDALQDVAVAFSKSAEDYPNTPVPQPELRVRPPL